MTKKTPIKIIKRDERNKQEKSTEQAKTTRETAHDMVSTVTNWVSEFQDFVPGDAARQRGLDPSDSRSKAAAPFGGDAKEIERKLIPIARAAPVGGRPLRFPAI
jgi:hypothetical protein